MQGRRITKDDYKNIVSYICDTYEQRKRKRKSLDLSWKEIDRQLRMEPEAKYKMRLDGSPDPAKAWMPEIEPPFQAQTQEILTADASRLLFPDQGAWFKTYAEINDDYLSRAENSPIVGGVPVKIDQESANDTALSWLMFLHSQYDFKAHYDLVLSDWITYGTAAPRARLVTKKTFMMTEKGVSYRDMKFPMLVPRSIKDVYLDDSRFHLNNEGHEVSPGIIQKKTQLYKDLAMAAKKGGSDPKSESGGWIYSNIEKIKKKGDTLEILEYEGDILVPRKTTESLYLPNVIVTVGIGQGADSAQLIRFRHNELETCSYIPHYYHRETPESAYGVSPLMKGMPIQKAISEALNRFLMSAAYDAQPAIQYSKDDLVLEKTGGPQIYPGACIPSTDPINALQIGNSSTLVNAYLSLVQQYKELTGTQSARMGAQTNSHTTAYAKQQEVSRGVVRTVDAVRAINNGPMYRWLDLCYRASLKTMGKKDYAVFNYGTRSYIETLNRDHLPENVHYEILGASAPAEDAAQSGAVINAIQAALNIELIKRQLQEGKPLDLEQLQRRFLETAKVNDVDELYISRTQNIPKSAPAGSEMGQAGGIDSGGAGLLLQNLATSMR